MSLEKAIQSGKEKRKAYRKSKAFDRSCRNHGTCNWCYDNRMYRTNRELERIAWEEIDFEENIDFYAISYSWFWYLRWIE